MGLYAGIERKKQGSDRGFLNLGREPLGISKLREWGLSEPWGWVRLIFDALMSKNLGRDQTIAMVDFVGRRLLI